MKFLHIAAIAFAAAAMMACSGSKTADTDQVAADTIAEGNTEIVIDSVGADSASVAGQAADGAVVVFDNESKAEPQGKPLVIDFTATWCGPCQQFKPTFHKVAEKYADKATFASADVDICTDLAQKYKIESIPYLLIINTDGTTASNMGKMSEAEFEAFLTKNLK